MSHFPTLSRKLFRDKMILMSGVISLWFMFLNVDILTVIYLQFLHFVYMNVHVHIFICTCNICVHTHVYLCSCADMRLTLSVFLNSSLSFTFYFVFTCLAEDKDQGLENAKQVPYVSYGQAFISCCCWWWSFVFAFEAWFIMEPGAHQSD